MNWRGAGRNVHDHRGAIADVVGDLRRLHVAVLRPRVAARSVLLDVRRRLRQRTSAFQNTLTKAAPLILTALCTALPARFGLIIIGGEGALDAWAAWRRLLSAWLLARLAGRSVIQSACLAGMSPAGC